MNRATSIITGASASRSVSDWIKCIDRLPEAGKLVLVFSPNTKHDWPGTVKIDMDYIDPDCEEPQWYGHAEHYEHFCCVAKPEGSIGPSPDAPYTHWAEIPPLPEGL